MAIPTIRFESTYFGSTMEEVMDKVKAGRAQFSDSVAHVDDDSVTIHEVFDEEAGRTFSEEAPTTFEATLRMRGW